MTEEQIKSFKDLYRKVSYADYTCNSAGKQKTVIYLNGLQAMMLFCAVKDFAKVHNVDLRYNK